MVRILSNLECPPPVDIWLSTAARFTDHFLEPVGVIIRADERILNCFWHLLQEAAITTASPACMVSPSRKHVPPHFALWEVNSAMPMESSSMFMMREPEIDTCGKS